MGVPTFYRWLTSRYPRVLEDVQDNLNEKDIDMAVVDSFGLALLSPNPNGEFDNLYIDMNGLIHPCCHPEAMEQPPSEDVMVQCIFDYIDRLFYLVRPRKLIYLAIDGVAPRAKMNQQRSRRFKAAAEADLEAETYEKVVAEFAARNIQVPEKDPKWDSNVITPGTPFMHMLSERLVEYINDRRDKLEAWSRIHVIYSDANTPGEGEHKIMNFIRNQRHSPNYDPNTRHVLHGMDADLIMLGLATHEVNFYIIREVVMVKNTRKQENEIRNSILEAQREPLKKETKLKSDKSYRSMLRQNWKNLQFIRLPVLREYLHHQLNFPSGWKETKKAIDIERCIDDVVLMCFFCGNDFLPHLPSISIPGGSIDQMILLYQNILPDLGDYLCNEGELNLEQCHKFVSYIAKVEDETFRMQHAHKERQKNREMQQQAAEKAQHKDNNDEKDVEVCSVHGNSETSDLEENTTKEAEATQLSTVEIQKEFKKRVSHLMKEHNIVDDPVDSIDLSLKDPQLWKAEYYKKKFCLTTDDEVANTAREVSAHYIRGMCWVLRYYYQGCPSWGWYYPYHYAPFCSDLNFLDVDVSFEYGEPFTPYQQLMSVMPIRSSHCLPPELSALMNDPDSPIASYYPTKFLEDPNGKKYRYQWIALLPFIDERKLLNIVEPIESQLSAEYQERNRRRNERLFVGREGNNNFVGELLERDNYYEFISKSDKKHESKLLEGAVIPGSCLRIDDIMEEGRGRGFNADGAKRLIMDVISKNYRGGYHGGYDGRKSEALGNFNRDFHQKHNQYDPRKCTYGDKRPQPYDSRDQRSSRYNDDRSNRTRGYDNTRYGDDHGKRRYGEITGYHDNYRHEKKPYHNEPYGSTSSHKNGDRRGGPVDRYPKESSSYERGHHKTGYRASSRDDRHPGRYQEASGSYRPSDVTGSKYDCDKHSYRGNSSSHYQGSYDRPNRSDAARYDSRYDDRRPRSTNENYPPSVGSKRSEHGTYPGMGSSQTSRHNATAERNASRYLGGLRLDPPRKPSFTDAQPPSQE